RAFEIHGRGPQWFRCKEGLCRCKGPAKPFILGRASHHVMKKRGLYLLSFITSFEDWVHWSERYNIMPCIARIPLASSRVAQWKKAWKSPYASEYSVLLESGKGG